MTKIEQKTLENIVVAIEHIAQCAKEHRSIIYITKLENGDLVYDIGKSGVCTVTIDSIQELKLIDLANELREALKKKYENQEINVQIIKKHWKYNVECIKLAPWK